MGYFRHQTIKAPPIVLAQWLLCQCRSHYLKGVEAKAYSIFLPAIYLLTPLDS
jgi:hypothetical protein